MNNAALPRGVAWGERCWLLLAIGVVAYFWRPLTVGTLFFRDLHFLHFAKKLMLVDAIRARELPLWDPLSQGGQPFLADPQSTLFYPSNVLYLVLDPVAAFNTAIVLQFVLCALGAFWLARVLDMSRAAAFVGGTIFALCGYTLSTANLMLPLFGLPWLPIALASCESFRLSGRARWFAAAALAGALPLFGGAPEIALIAYATLAGWILVSGARASDQVATHARRAVRAALLFAAIAGLAMVQIVPTVEMISESSRGAGIPLEQFGGWSVDARRLPELFIPEFLGPTDRLREEAYWGRNLEDEGYPYILSIYFGLPVLLLAGAGTFSRASVLPRQLRILLWVLIAIAVLIAAGRNQPLFEMLYRLPLVSVFRFPVKAVALAVAPIALLAAAGTDSIGERDPRRRLAWIALVCAVFLATLGAAIFTSSGFSSWFQALFFAAADPGVSGPLAGRFTHAAAVSAAFGLILLVPEKRLHLVPTLVAGIVAADVAIAGANVNNYAPREFFSAPATVRAVKAAVGEGRLYRSPNPDEFRLESPADDNVWFARWNLQVLTDYTGLTYGIPLVFHEDYGALGPRRVVELGATVSSLRWAARFPLLEAAGCGAALTPDLLRSRTPDVVLRNASRTPFFVYRLEGRQAWFATDGVVADDSSVKAALTAGKVERPPLFLAAPANETQPCAGGAVSTRRWSRNERSFAVTAPCAGYLAVSQSFYPGWTARVDGRDSPIVRANYAFTAVYLGTGTHVIDLAYRPRSVLIGAVASSVTVLLLAGVAIVRRRKRASSSQVVGQ